MANSEAVYVVHQGDHIALIAHRLGVDADKLWKNPKHDRLRKAGRTPDLLRVGDVLYVPVPSPKWMPVKVGQVNQFTCKVPTMPVALTITGKAFANAKCVVHGLRPTDTFTTDGDGKLRFTAPVTSSHFDVEFPDLGYHLRLMVGHLDPITEPSGQQQRLQNLGYCSAELAAAVRRYQRDHALAITGEVDEPTRSHLEDRYGC